MTSLTSDQINDYNINGYLAPINVLTKNEASEVRKEIEKIEKLWPNELDGLGRNYVHMISPVFDKVCHSSKILDAVESIIGKNILIGGTTLFIKNPDKKGFVSFHQDAKYIGLEPHNWVTAWVAITDSNKHNGCMRVWSGSHKDNLKDHDQNFNERNLLTRGQTINNVPKEKTTPLILKAGQMSLHHPAVVHGSELNHSNDRRIGFVIQSYIGTNVKQVLGKNSVQLARGKDNFNFHKKIGRPKFLLHKNDLKIKKRENDNLQEIFYKGSSKKGNY